VSRPLVTFALFAYNQEKFIREAVKGALAQTYAPLQIILSDDCSRDNTFKVMREVANDYEGPHEIVLNRNVHNLGMGGHINRVMEVAKGELIVVAAGDDISRPTRTEELVAAWSSGGVFCLCSNVTIMDEGGVDRAASVRIPPIPVESWQEAIQHAESHAVLGCTHAWDRLVFDTFGPLPYADMHEDLTIRYRASLLGKVAYVDKPLVRWRRHGKSSLEIFEQLLRMNPSRLMDHRLTSAHEYSREYEVWLRDTRLFQSSHPHMETELSQAIESLLARIEYQRFVGTIREGSMMDRLRRGARTLGAVRSLGLTQMGKVCLLSLSPISYYRMQLHYMKLSELLNTVR
jgi:glycosyltransferase involved in cell wall biosynthesis